MDEEMITIPKRRFNLVQHLADQAVILQERVAHQRRELALKNQTITELKQAKQDLREEFFDLLKKYGRHIGTCHDNIVGGYDYPCSCGLDKLRKGGV